MATFKFELQKKKKDGTRNVKIILTHERKLKRLPTNIYVSGTDLTKSGKLKNQLVIDKIEDLMRKYRNKCNALSTGLNGMDIQALASYLEEESEDLDFIKIFREYISSHKEKKGIKNYRSALNALIKFIENDKLGISDISVSFLEKLEKSLTGRAVSLYLGSIRHVYMYAKLKYNDEERGIIRIPYNPFERYRVPKQNVAIKRALEASIIREIIDMSYDAAKSHDGDENRFNLAKDCFILSFCLIGMNSVDLYNCHRFEKGMIIYERTKTKDRRSDRAEIHVSVSHYIKKLFNKYHDKTGQRVFVFYQMYSTESTFNAALNKGLKRIGEKLGIEKLEFYSARHSWATIARNDLMIDKSTINDALNHIDNSMSVTDLYIKKDFSAINKANEKVLDYIFGNKSR